MTTNPLNYSLLLIQTGKVKNVYCPPPTVFPPPVMIALLVVCLSIKVALDNCYDCMMTTYACQAFFVMSHLEAVNTNSNPQPTDHYITVSNMAKQIFKCNRMFGILTAVKLSEQYFTTHLVITSS